MEVTKIGDIKVDSSINRNSYFDIRGQSKIKSRCLVRFGGVFDGAVDTSEELSKLGFYNISGLIDDFSSYTAEISFEDMDKLKIVRIV